MKNRNPDVNSSVQVLIGLIAGFLLIVVLVLIKFL